jgi:L-lysine 6-transaminase
MVRARRILEVIESDQLIDRAAELGAHLLAGLHALAARHDAVTDVRGRGLMCAFTLPSAARRDEVVRRLREDEHVLVLGCGEAALRFRPPLTVGYEDLDRGLAALDRVLAAR